MNTPSAKLAPDGVLKVGPDKSSAGAAIPQPHPEAPIDKSLFGLLMFIGSEVMIFAGLISSYLILRANAESWPPVGQPRLPTGVTGVNTLVLALSLLTMYRAVKQVRSPESGNAPKWFATTAALGGSFLAIQGYEWLRLITFGMTYASSIFGATFYTLIGFHALHVFGAMIGLIIVLRKAAKGVYTASRHTGVLMCACYWSFVVAVWLALYGLVYLS